ncbi:MAG: hypothetical protein F4Y49_08730 [Dehalococcoidia bacterium]|nr:hypothetical protein [Dehalococcoidia bacterium]
MTMRMRQPEGQGRGNGPGMRDADDEPKRYIGLRYPESFVQKIRLAADSKNMRVAEYVRECIEEQVESDVEALARRLSSELLQ